jgi:ribonuclease P protein component
VVVALHGHAAVERNKLKRRLRELVRTVMLPHLHAVDVLIRARREAYAADFAALRADVTHATDLLRAAGTS